MTGSIDRMVVDKVKLLEALKTNKKKYKELYELAVKNYWKLAVLKLTKMLERAKAKRKIEFLNITLPVNHENDYDLVIKMLEFSEDKNISLTPAEFSKYILNDWSWKSEFIGVTTVLAKGAYYGYSGISGYSGYAGITTTSPKIEYSGNLSNDEDDFDYDEETKEFLDKIDKF